MDGKKIDQDPMQMPTWSLGMAMAWIARREVEGATELWQEGLGAALLGEDGKTTWTPSKTPGWLRRSGVNSEFLEAETALKNALTEGSVSATALLPDGTRIAVPSLEWEDMEFSYGIDADGDLMHRGTNKAGAMYTELRVKREDILAKWQAKQVAPTDRRRGPKGGKLEAVKKKMIAYNNAHGDLASMKEVEMEAHFGASRDWCRRARRDVLGFADN